jgi:putative membrane protein
MKKKKKNKQKTRKSCRLFSLGFSWGTGSPEFKNSWNSAPAMLLGDRPSPQLKELPMKVSSLVVLAMFATSPALAASEASQAFLKKAIEGNYAEIEMGKLAQQNGQNDNVKKFGQMLQDDHSAANQKAMDAAKSMNVTPPDGPSAKQKAEYDKMTKMSGARFDRDFATHMVADHEKDIAEYKKEARQSDAAGEYAKAQIEVLQKHLDTAKSLRSTKSSSR